MRILLMLVLVVLLLAGCQTTPKVSGVLTSEVTGQAADTAGPKYKVAYTLTITQ